MTNDCNGQLCYACNLILFFNSITIVVAIIAVLFTVFHIYFFFLIVSGITVPCHDNIIYYLRSYQRTFRRKLMKKELVSKLFFFWWIYLNLMFKLSAYILQIDILDNSYVFYVFLLFNFCFDIRPLRVRACRQAGTYTQGWPLAKWFHYSFSDTVDEIYGFYHRIKVRARLRYYTICVESQIVWRSLILYSGYLAISSIN